ncbi:MAG: hypothetical protein ACXW1R_07280 [Halobacteriota archaeon]
MPYIVAISTLMIFAAFFHLAIGGNLVASFFVGLVWATFTGIFAFLWQRGWYGMLDKNRSTVLVNVVILSTGLIGVAAIDGISSEARLLLQFMVLGTGAAGQALGWLHSYHAERNRASSRKEPQGSAI